MTPDKPKSGDSAKRRSARAARSPSLSPGERAALEAAERRFLDWRIGPAAVPTLDATKLTALHEGAAAALRALEGLLEPRPTINRERARLLTLMQMQEGGTRTQTEYRDALQEMQATLAKVVRASAPFAARPGGVADEDVYLWIAFAAEAWAGAGYRVSPRGRFADALREFKPSHLKVPRAPGESRMREAVGAWRAAGGDPNHKATQT
jgi:hypothetical protein